MAEFPDTLLFRYYFPAATSWCYAGPARPTAILADADAIAINIAECHGGYRGQL